MCDMCDEKELSDDDDDDDVCVCVCVCYDTPQVLPRSPHQ